MYNASLVDDIESLEDLEGDVFDSFGRDWVVNLIDPVGYIVLSFLHHNVCGEVLVKSAVDIDDVWVFGQNFQYLELPLEILRGRVYLFDGDNGWNLAVLALFEILSLIDGSKGTIRDASDDLILIHFKKYILTVLFEVTGISVYFDAVFSIPLSRNGIHISLFVIVILIKMNRETFHLSTGCKKCQNYEEMLRWQ